MFELSQIRESDRDGRYDPRCVHAYTVKVDATRAQSVFSCPMKPFEAPTVILYEDDRPQSILVRKCKLLVASGPEEGDEILINKDTFTIGANTHNDLSVRDSTVSGNHCEIELLEEGYLLRDLQSTNGTFIGGVRITEAFLDEGTEFRIGKARYVFSPLDESTEVKLIDDDHFGEMIGRSAAMKRIFQVVQTYAPTEATILVNGATGSGKEMLAREIHRHSKRADKPFVVVDCSALSRGLIESELFGHTKGSFTGAQADRKGAFEQAHMGTVFLDEIGDLSPDLQPKLLRVLEQKEIRRVGSNDIRPVDVRILAATHRKLEREVNAGRFREDLFYRLSVVKVVLPPLAQRKSDVPVLVRKFVENLAPNPAAENIDAHTERILSMFSDYDWPGNVRELRNMVERLYHAMGGSVDVAQMMSPDGDGEDAADVEEVLEDETGEIRPFKEAKESLVSRFERTYIERMLARHDGNVSQAAREAQIERAYLQRLVKKHGLR